MPLLRSSLRPLPCAVAVLALSAGCLAGPARDAMDPLTSATVLLHIALGCAVIVPVGWALVRARRAFKRPGRFVVLCLALFACVCAASGIYLAMRAAAGHSTAREVAAGQLHILGGLGAVMFAALLWWFPRTQRKGPTDRPTVGTVVAGAALLLTLTQGALFGEAALLPAYNADDYYRNLTATNAAQAQNPLFPAGVELQSVDGSKTEIARVLSLPTSQRCGEPGCHPAAYREWEGSAHHFAGTDPFYAAVLKERVRGSGQDAGRWCQGCHAPYAAVRVASGEGPRDVLSRDKAEGVGCYVCHAISSPPTRTGNGRFVLAEQRDYPFAAARGWRRGLHDFLLRVRPGPHQRAFLSPGLHRSAEFCSSCHRQSMTVAQNHYQFVRGPDEYGEWARGPASARAARSSIGAGRTCQECHFRTLPGNKVAARISHASPGGNTALAALTGDGAIPEALTTRMERAVSLDLFALRRAGTAARGEVWNAPLDGPRAGYALHPGESLWLDVVVCNRGVGHSFPAGYTDLTEAWLEVTVADANSRTLLTSGVVTDAGSALPPDAHIYGSLGLDRLGKPILRHNLTDQVTTVYQRVIPAGGCDIARFRLTVPSIGTGPGQAAAALRLTARLRYRAVRPDFARWALAADGPSVTGPAAFVPPVTTLAEASLSLPLIRGAVSPGSRDATWRRLAAERFLHYGTGLLAPVDKPDIGGAVRAFRAASELAPESPDPWLGLGRAFLREPDLRLAAVNFERALRCSPGNPAATAELSVVYNKQGQPARAIQLLAPLVEAFPEDGALRFDLGLALFRTSRYSEAASSFRCALGIDPDSYAAHFELKRCYEVLRNIADARREDSVTRYMAEDRAGPLLVPPYLAAHGEASLRAAPFPVHELRPVPGRR